MNGPLGGPEHIRTDLKNVLLKKIKTSDSICKKSQTFFDSFIKHL